MLKVIYLIFLKIFILSVVNASDKNGPIVSTNSGSVLGEILITELNQLYYSFKGIPYAEPPLGDLRFRAPVEHHKWKGVRSATKHGKICIQPSPKAEASEDCLFLNIYSKDLTSKSAVLVFIHGGSYTRGSGDTSDYGPDYLLGENIVVVTLNYRLGILGFLSTADKYAPGNYGFKDIALALKWINENIENFGGDRNNITIAGYSSGAATVDFMMLSPVTRGLFNKAILLSGTSLSPWAFQQFPLDITYDIAKKLNIKTNSSKSFIESMRNIDANEFPAATVRWSGITPNKGIASLPLAATQDPDDVPDNEIFIPSHPKNLFLSEHFNHIPVLIGQTDYESFHFVQLNKIDELIFGLINHNPNILIPYSWNGLYDPQVAHDIASEIRNFYFNGQNLSKDLYDEWAAYMTDIMFTIPIYEHNVIQNALQNKPIFQYVFNYVGSLNMQKVLKNQTNFPGAIHGDDLFYIFKSDRAQDINENDYANIIRKQYIRLLTNFVKYGVPTPVLDETIPINWLPLMNDQEYFRIGNEIAAENYPFAEKILFWNNLKEMYIK